MSSRRPKRQIIPMMPMDTLSSPPLKKHHHTYESLKNSPTRYRKGARSIVIPEKKINRLSSRTFIPSSPTDGDNPSNSNQDELRKLRDREDQFEPIIDSSPLRKPDRTRRNREKSEGLLTLSSSPSSVSRSPGNNLRQFKTDTIKYNIPGILDTIILQKNKNLMIKPIFLSFSDDKGLNPYLAFTHKGIQLSDLYVDFNRDCEKIIFDLKFSRFAIVLKKERSYSYDNKRSGRTRIFVWINSILEDFIKLKKLKNSLMKSNARYEIQTMSLKDIQREVARLNNAFIKIRIQSLAENATADAFNEQQRNSRSSTEFLKKNLSSLQNKPSLSSNLRSLTRTGRSIPIPRSQGLISKSNISADNFYSNGRTPLHDKNLAELRRANRKGRNINAEDISNTKEEEKNEITQIFKPKLKYQFSDETKYTITNQDFKCLYNNDWINDTLIDFFTKYYDDRASNNGILKREEVYIITSFFYTKLISDPKNYYENVKKWVQNTDLSTKKYIIIPININYHWFGCIIYNFDLLFKSLQEKQIEQLEKAKLKENRNIETDNDLPKEEIIEKTSTYKDETIENENTLENKKDREKKEIMDDSDSDDLTEIPPICQILTFDSLRGIHSKDLDPIKEFLIAYAKDKFSLTIDKSLIKMKTCLVPQQPNMSDCGVHVILTIKKFFEKPQETIKVWNSINRKSRETSKIINEYFEKNRRNVTARKELRGKLLKLLENQVKLQKDRNIESDDSDSNNNKEDNYDDEDLEIIENIPEPQEKTEKNDKIYNKSEDLLDTVAKNSEGIKSSDSDYIIESNKQASIEGQAEEDLVRKVNNIDEQNYRNDIDNLSHITEHAYVNDSRTSELSSVPPSPTPSKFEAFDGNRSIQTEDIKERKPESISVKVHLNDKISTHLPETVISSEDKTAHFSDNVSRGEELITTAIHEPVTRVSSKYFRSYSKQRRMKFQGEHSPVLSDQDYRTTRTDESRYDEISPLRARPNVLINSAVDHDNSQNIVVSDVENDDDVNLIGQSSNIEISTPGDSTPEQNIRGVNGLEEDDNIENIKNNINKELYAEDSHNLIDLSSPTKADVISNLIDMKNTSAPPSEPSDSSDQEKAQNSILID